MDGSALGLSGSEPGGQRRPNTAQIPSRREQKLVRRATKNAMLRGNKVAPAGIGLDTMKDMDAAVAAKLKAVQRSTAYKPVITKVGRGMSPHWQGV